MESTNNASSSSSASSSTSPVATTTTTTTTSTLIVEPSSNNNSTTNGNIDQPTSSSNNENTNENNNNNNSNTSTKNSNNKRPLTISSYNNNTSQSNGHVSGGGGGGGGGSGGVIQPNKLLKNINGGGSTSTSSTASASGNTAASTAKEIDDSLSCPICLQILKEPFITRCGHSFCYQCILTQISEKTSCPICLQYLTRDQIFPNFALNTMVEKFSHTHLSTTPPIKQLQNTITNENISLNDINNIMATLIEKKKVLELQDQQVEYEILLDFLSKTKGQKMEAYKQLKKQIVLLEQDIMAIESEKMLNDNAENNGTIETTANTTTSGTSSTSFVSNVQSKDSSKEMQKLENKKRKIDTHLEDLQNCYFSTYNEIENNTSILNNNKNTLSNNNNTSSTSIGNGNTSGDILLFDDQVNRKIGRGLLTFSKNLSRFTRYNEFKVLSTLKYGDLFNTSSIVSSIEFDKDDEFFATAGVTKKIKVFEFAQVTMKDIDVHAPVKEMVCRSKISCLSWNTYFKHQIASSDYEGIITLWDVNTGQEMATMEEHEKRVWSVDFSRTDPTQFASGSDDTKVKLWSTTQKKALTTIESKANICCVKFNPSFSHLIAFGSADHHIHYYDLRQPTTAVSVFKGHRKAVSYVKFMNKDEIISASTDSTLKLWNVNSSESCVRTYSGHSNEKNFVGLAVNGDYICCGSENNGVYTYYKALSKPIVTHRFGANSGSGEETDEDGTQFVSSVCWKKDSNILLAANSQGNIKVLELF